MKQQKYKNKNTKKDVKIKEKQNNSGKVIHIANKVERKGPLVLFYFVFLF